LGGFQSKPGLATIAKSMEAMLAAAPKGFEAYLRKVRSQKTDAAAPHCSWLKRVAKRVLKGKGYRNKIVLDLPPFRHLFDVFQPGSVLEVGCGLGAYLLYLEQLGAKDVFGMDGTQPSASLLENHRYLQHDLTAPFELGRQFDLVICVGVVDHLETSSEDFLKRLSKHAAGRILFSAAEPGQPGVGHSHCRPLEYWLASWDDLGWECDVQATLAFRSLATFAKLRRNPMVLQRKSGSGNVSQRPSILQEIARKPYKWYGREAAIITRPLSEVPPDNVYR
jgi:SAM-dependent methyltransferase